ncbi:hypothetical protein [Clostridium sp. JNZ J1-5]
MKYINTQMLAIQLESAAQRDILIKYILIAIPLSFFILAIVAIVFNKYPSRKGSIQSLKRKYKNTNIAIDERKLSILDGFGYAFTGVVYFFIELLYFKNLKPTRINNMPFFLLAIILIAFYVAYYRLRTKFVKITSLNTQDIVVKNVIESAHKILDSIINSDSPPSESDFLDIKNGEGKKLKKALIQVTYEPLRKDLEDVIKYINTGADTFNLEDIIEAHKIIHDLDMHAYKNKDKDEQDYFDASYTVRVLKNNNT